MAMLIISMPLKLFSARTSFYYEYEGSNLQYTIVDNEARECWVTGYKSFSDDLVIPEVAMLGKTGYTVTQIEESALRQSWSLTNEIKSVVIPNTVTKIGQWAFYGNNVLERAVIGESVKEMGRDVFEDCPLKTLIFNAVNCESDGTKEKPIFPSSVETLKFGEKVERIPGYSFAHCNNLTAVDLPNSVNKIGDGAFEWCGEFSINLSKNLAIIGTDAFFACSLTSIDLPNSLEIIEERAFYGCCFTSIEIPNSVLIIEDEAFGKCESLTTVIFNADDCQSCGILYPVFPDSVNTLLIGDNVRTIPYKAFRNLNLEYVYIPNSVKEIGDMAFQYCKMKTIEIPSSVESIGEAAFGYCFDLTELAFNATACLTCGSSDHPAFPNSITNLSVGTNVTVIPAYAFKNFQDLISVEIPNSVNTIGMEAFCDCSSLTSAIIPNSVTEISDGTFSGCRSLTYLGIPDSLTKIGNKAFYNCINLQEIEIPNTVSEIGALAFFGCQGFSSITIPNSIRSIGYQAFENCGNLTTVIFNAEDCELCGSLDISTFPQKVSTLTLGGKVSRIPDFAFFGCAVESIVIPNSVTYIGNGAFKMTDLKTLIFNAMNCATCGSLSEPAFPETLATLTIGDKITRIPDYAFNQCLNLTSIDIPNTVTLIGESAFAECIRLTSVAIGSSVTTIEKQAFMNCPLTTIIIPSTVTEIGERAFSGCSLETITIGSGLKFIGQSAFNNNTSISNIYITAQTPPTISEETFNDYSAKLWLQGETARSAYEQATPWNHFDQAYMVTPTGIDNWGYKTINGKPGEKYGLNVTLLPENVTLPYIFWHSTNSDVATVSTSNSSTVTLNPDIETGSCTIIGESLYADGPIVEIPVRINMGNIGVTNITLNETELELIVGSTATLIATVESDGVTDTTVTWSSSNENIATVDSNGNVLAIAAGEVVIEARCGNVKAICNITVIPILVENIILSDTEITLSEGRKFTISAIIIPEDATNKNILWSSSDMNVAIVSSNGTITAVGVGDAIITATAADGTGINASAYVSVSESKTHEYIATYDFKKPLSLTPPQNVNTSNDPVCEIGGIIFNNNGLTLIANGGNTSPRLWYNYSTDSPQLRIYNGGQITISAQEESTEILGIEITGNQLDALVINGNTLGDNTQISWVLEEPSNSLSLDCRTNGTHKRADISTITIKCRGYSGNDDTPILVESLTIDPTEWSGEEGSEFTIVANVLPENAENKALTFESSATSVATVDADGNVKVLKEGSCIITVSTVDGSNLRAECVITSLSGVDAIFVDPNAEVDVYDMHGILLRKGCTREELKQLTPDVYILRSGNTVVKALLR